MTETEIRLDRVSKRFAPDARAERADGGRGPRGAQAAGAAVDGVSLDVARGEILAVVGPSGCGKSTTLRLIAGLDDPDEGTVAIGGRPMKGVAPQDRDVAMVFQGYALYPQMTVRQILEFPLKMRGLTRVARASAVDEAAALLRLEPFLGRRPGELSGGERQRVAMGRAIVRKARVFLFDEPLSNLDASLRGELRLELGRLVRRLGVTAVYVTHDHVEAMTLGDRLAVMRKGRIVQVGTPREVYERPASAFVGAFLGSPRMNLLPARIEGDVLVAGAFRFPLPGSLRGKDRPARVEAGVRPEHVRVTRSAGGAGSTPGSADVAEGASAPGELVAVEPLGAETHVVVRVGELEVRARVPGIDDGRRGDAVIVTLDSEQIAVFAADGEGERLA